MICALGRSELLPATQTNTKSSATTLCTHSISASFTAALSRAGGNQREDGAPPRCGAARHDHGEAAPQPRCQRGRHHVQRLHAAAPGCGPTGRRHRQPTLPVWRRHDAAEHGG